MLLIYCRHVKIHGQAFEIKKKQEKSIEKKKMENNCLRPDKNCLYHIFVLVITHRLTNSYSFVVTIVRSVNKFLKQKKTKNVNKKRKEKKKLLLKTWQDLYTF